MRTILILLLIATLTSCLTQKRCNQKFPPQISITEKESVRDSIVYYKDTVYIPGAQVTITDSVPCPELEFERSVTKNNLTASVKISKGKINIDCKSDSLQKELNLLRHYIIKDKSKSEVKVKTVIEYKVKWYDYVARVFALILLLIILSIFARSYLK